MTRAEIMALLALRVREAQRKAKASRDLPTFVGHVREARALLDVAYLLRESERWPA